VTLMCIVTSAIKKLNLYVNFILFFTHIMQRAAELSREFLKEI
jgi:hypothetical protein